MLDGAEIMKLFMEVFVRRELLNQRMILHNRCTMKDFEMSYSESVTQSLNNPFTVIAKHEGKIIGLIMANASPTEDYLNHSISFLPFMENIVRNLIKNRKDPLNISHLVHVEFLLVANEYQGKGIAGKLVQKGIKRGQKRTKWGP